MLRDNVDRPAVTSTHTNSRSGEYMAGELRRLLTDGGIHFLMEAHSGVSAKIVAETGFSAIWASGLTMSASLGLRDANEASWTQVLDIVECMTDAVEIPVLVDGDTGYGNFNSVRRLVLKLCQRGVAGVCLEDKLFPKTNSFIGENQELADPLEFTGKIKAAKDSQLFADFCVVARVEALIANRGLREALHRAELYRGAGADAILIHSKQSNGCEIFEFLREWAGRSPTVIVPTMYPTVPTPRFKDAGVSAVIWANQNLRASIAAMRSVSQEIYLASAIASSEELLPKVKEIFALTNEPELAVAEKKYLPSVVGTGIK